MARPASRFPTPLELAILKVIWAADAKGLPVKAVREALVTSDRILAYTSVLTTMTIMLRKGYLKRKVMQNGLYHSYLANIKQDATRKAMLLDVVDRAYDGDVAAAVKDLAK